MVKLVRTLNDKNPAQIIFFRMRVKFLEFKFPLELMKPEIIFRPFMFRVKLKLTGNSVQIVLY